MKNICLLFVITLMILNVSYSQSFFDNFSVKVGWNGGYNLSGDDGSPTEGNSRAYGNYPTDYINLKNVNPKSGFQIELLYNLFSVGILETIVGAEYSHMGYSGKLVLVKVDVNQNFSENLDHLNLNLLNRIRWFKDKPPYFILGLNLSVPLKKGTKLINIIEKYEQTNFPVIIQPSYGVAPFYIIGFGMEWSQELNICTELRIRKSFNSFYEISVKDSRPPVEHPSIENQRVYGNIDLSTYDICLDLIIPIKSFL